VRRGGRRRGEEAFRKRERRGGRRGEELLPPQKTKGAGGRMEGGYREEDGAPLPPRVFRVLRVGGNRRIDEVLRSVP